MTRLGVALALLVLATLTLAACDDGGTPVQSATVTAEGTVTATSSPAAAATIVATPTDEPTPAAPQVGLLLVDLVSGQAHTLYEGDEYALTRRFEADGSLWVWHVATQSATRFSPRAEPLEESDDWPWDDQRCRNVPGGEATSVVGGETFPVACGPLSPDGRWMMFTRDIESANVPAGGYETWLLDIETRVEHLLTDLTRHCGGCDYRAGPAWSPSGRFLLFGETYAGPDSTVYLTDTATLDTRIVAQGPSANNLGEHLTWSSSEDAFARPGEGGIAVIARPALSEALPLNDVPWPARFDETGQFVYSVRDRTTVADAATGATVALWTGTVQLWPSPRGMTAVDGKPAALVEDGGCAGTTVYHPDIEGLCIEGARGAAWSPDAAAVAFARPTEQVSVVREWERDWEVVVLDIATQREQIVASGLRRWTVPYIVWNDAGTQLVVLWPAPELL